MFGGQYSCNKIMVSDCKYRDQRVVAHTIHRVNLSLGERHEYIDAVKCLMRKPAKTPMSFAPGARNRMDDFTASHVNQTLFIHFSVSLRSSPSSILSQPVTNADDRDGSYLGIDTLSGNTKRLCATNVAIGAPNRTGTGPKITTTSLNIHSSMGRSTPWAETV